MLRKIVFYTLSILSLIVLLICCDRVGNLSYDESTQLYNLIKQDIEEGKLWEQETSFLHHETDLKDETAFLRMAVETVFDNEKLNKDIYGGWFDNKDCQIIRIVCQVSIFQNETNYIIDELQIAKYINSDMYKIWLYYHRNEGSSKSKYIEVVMR